MNLNIPAVWRKRIYTAAAILQALSAVGITLLLGFHVITPDQVKEGVEAATAIFGAFASILALAHVTPDDSQ